MYTYPRTAPTSRANYTYNIRQLASYKRRSFPYSGFEFFYNMDDYTEVNRSLRQGNPEVLLSRYNFFTVLISLWIPYEHTQRMLHLQYVWRIPLPWRMFCCKIWRRWRIYYGLRWYRLTRRGTKWRMVRSRRIQHIAHDPTPIYNKKISKHPSLFPRI